MTAPTLQDLIVSRASLAGISLSDVQRQQLTAYYALLGRWNQKINLTALPLASSNPRTIDRLLVEPLIAAREVAEGPLIWFDFGSGGGSPAIPLKIMRPRAILNMVEAKERKSAFLREAVSNLGLQQATVVTSRIEAIAASKSRAAGDLVTIRAVRPDEGVLGAARDVLKLHGSLLMFRGAEAVPVAPPGFVFEGERTLAPSEGILSTFRRTNR